MKETSSENDNYSNIDRMMKCISDDKTIFFPYIKTQQNVNYLTTNSFLCSKCIMNFTTLYKLTHNQTEINFVMTKR